MGFLRYYLGSMYAGKSSNAVQLLLQSDHAQKFIVSPTAHSRGFVSRLHPHSSLPRSVQICYQVADLPARFAPDKDTLIFIDEVQFLDSSAFWQLLAQAQSATHLDIILAGLTYDQHGKPFANYHRLADLFPPALQQRLYVECATCQEHSGEISIRKWHTNDRITDDYAVLCRHCFDAFFHRAPANASLCAICQQQSASIRLRQWRHDAALIDGHALLCSDCYQRISDYGNHYAHTIATSY